MREKHQLHATSKPSVTMGAFCIGRKIRFFFFFFFFFVSFVLKSELMVCLKRAFVIMGLRLNTCKKNKREIHGNFISVMIGFLTFYSVQHIYIYFLDGIDQDQTAKLCTLTLELIISRYMAF